MRHLHAFGKLKLIIKNMNNFNFLKNKKILIGIAIIAIVLIIALVLKFPSQKKENSSEQNSDQSTTSKTTVKTVPVAQKAGISMVSPAEGEIWLMGKVHSIRWTRQEGHTGSIVLMDASSKDVVGWITPSLSFQQVAYDWDVLRVAPSRNNPPSKEIFAGTYIIRVVFDSSNVKIDSVPFQIISSGTDKILNREIFIENGIFIPNYIEIKKGERIVMINNDGDNIRTLKGVGVVLAKLAPRDSYVFPATQSGRFEFLLAENAISKLTVVVN